MSASLPLSSRGPRSTRADLVESYLRLGGTLPGVHWRRLVLQEPSRSIAHAFTSRVIGSGAAACGNHAQSFTLEMCMEEAFDLEAGGHVLMLCRACLAELAPAVAEVAGGGR